MKAVLVVAALACGLAGGQTKQLNEMSYSELKAVAEDINKRCIAQGIQPKSAEWDACVKQEVLKEHTTRIRNRQAVNDLGNGLAAAGEQMQAQAAASRPINCVSNRFGTMVTTNCY